MEEQQLPEGAESPKGSRKDGLLMLLVALPRGPCATSAVPMRNSNHFWTHSSGSPAGSGMLPAFPISPRSSPSLPAGDPSRARQFRQPQPRASRDFVSAAACFLLQGLGSGAFGTTPLLARVSCLSIPLGINPAPAKQDKGHKGWGWSLAHPYTPQFLFPNKDHPFPHLQEHF